MQSGTPRHTRIFDKMVIINIITNTYSCSIKAVDTRYGNTIYSTGIPLREIPTHLVYSKLPINGYGLKINERHMPM